MKVISIIVLDFNNSDAMLFCAYLPGVPKESTSRKKVFQEWFNLL